MDIEPSMESLNIKPLIERMDIKPSIEYLDIKPSLECLNIKPTIGSMKPKTETSPRNNDSSSLDSMDASFQMAAVDTKSVLVGSDVASSALRSVGVEQFSALEERDGPCDEAPTLCALATELGEKEERSDDEKPLQGEEDGETAAFIVDFEYGEKTLDERYDVGYNYYRSTSADINLKRKRMLVAETNEMSYVGEPVAITEDEPVTYMVGIFDYKTNKVQFVDAELCVLRPVTTDEPSIEAADESERKMSFMAKSDRLVSELGSARGRREASSRQRNELEGEALEAVIESAVNDASLSQTGATPAHHDQFDLPTCHRDASNIADVYPLSEIILPVEMEALSECELPALFAPDVPRSQLDEWRNSKTYPIYVLDHLEFMSSDLRVRSERTRHLMYLYYMFELYRMKPSDLRRPHPFLQPMPEVIELKLLEKFTVITEDKKGKVVRSMPKRLRDSLVTHLLVVCLALDSFVVNCASLLEDLLLTTTSLRAYVTSLGVRWRVERRRAEDSDQVPTKFFMALQLPLRVSTPKRSRSNKNL